MFAADLAHPFINGDQREIMLIVRRFALLLLGLMGLVQFRSRLHYTLAVKECGLVVLPAYRIRAAPTTNVFFHSAHL